MSQKLIPHTPKRIPLIGDVLGMDSVSPMQATAAMIGRLGPIYQRRILGTRLVFVGGADLVAETSDETVWGKHVGRPLEKLRPAAGDGLFTAYDDEPNWAIGHRVLAPGFTATAMRSYHATMVEVADELTTYWDQATGPIDVAGDMTKVTFETIGRVGFGYRFDQFDRTDTDPFITAMLGVLDFAQSAGFPIPVLESVLNRKRIAENNDDIDLLRATVQQVIDARRTNGGDQPDDLLARMLTTVDNETGRTLDDANIVNQVLTFLIAGHETTANSLAFSLYYLASNPDVLAAARAEVDAMFPAEQDVHNITHAQVPKLRYLRRVIDESLRLWPTVPGYFRRAKTHTSLAGKYDFAPDDWVLVVVNALHRDPTVWEDPERFNPDRFTSDQVKARHPHAFKPFGTGERSCIGRQFAYHEMVIVLATILRRYDLELEDGYQLSVQEALALKPTGLRMTVTRRQ